MENQERQSVDAPGAAAGEDIASVSDPTAQVSLLVSERDALAAEKTDLQDRLLRRQAEFENFRKRTEREKAEFFEFAGMETTRSLIPILDDFERALKVECQDAEYVKGME